MTVKLKTTEIGADIENCDVRMSICMKCAFLSLTKIQSKKPDLNNIHYIMCGNEYWNIIFL